MRGASEHPLIQTDALDDDDDAVKRRWRTNDPAIPVTTARYRLGQNALFIAQVVAFVLIVLQFIMIYRKYAVACGGVAAIVGGEAALVGYGPSPSSLPDYYVTKPELYPGRYDGQRCYTDETLY
jgi:hypothetical protein